jgi:hypothetical protein
MLPSQKNWLSLLTKLKYELETKLTDIRVLRYLVRIEINAKTLLRKRDEIIDKYLKKVKKCLNIYFL